MIALLIFFIGYLILNVYENYFRDEEKFYLYRDKEYAKKAQKLWKHYQFMQWFLVFVFIIFLTLPLKNLYSFLQMKNLYSFLQNIHLLLIFATWWNILYDGGLNLLRGLPFLRVSNTTQSRIERNIPLWIRISLLIIFTLTYLWWMI